MNPVPAPSRFPSYRTAPTGERRDQHDAEPRDDTTPQPRNEPEPPRQDPLPELPDPTEVGEDG